MTAKTGYHFYPSHYSPAIGHDKLEVVLAPAPTERVFDCAGFHLRVLEADHDAPTTISIVHNNEIAERRYRVALGRFWLYDFTGHSLEGFSFGGKLIVVHNNDRTVCSFESEAPIFELETDTIDVERVFVDEVEAIAGVLRAEWRDSSDVEWLASLAAIKPSTLFVSCLVTVQAYLNDVSSNGTYAGDSQRLKSWIRRTIHTLQDAGEWPEHTLTLAELEQRLNRSQKSPIRAHDLVTS